MEPIRKAPALEGLLEKTFGRTTAITSNKCVTPPIGCGLQIPVGEIETWDDLARREYRISGMCKTCQDNFFGQEPI